MVVAVILHLSSFTLWGPDVEIILPQFIAVFPLGLLAQRAKGRGRQTWWAPYLAIYIGFNFFYCAFRLHFGHVEGQGGQYYFNNHGTFTPATALEYAWGKEHLLRMFTGHLILIYLCLGDDFAGKSSGWPLKPTLTK